MASTINFGVKIGGDAGGLRSELSSAGRSVALWSSQITKNFAFIGSGIKGLVVGQLAAAVPKLGGELADSVKQVLEASRKAEQLGLPVQEFTALGHAANMVGVDVGGLGDVLKNWEKQLAGVRMGNQEVGVALAAVGVQWRDFAGLSVTEQLAKLADGFAGVEDPATRARSAMVLLGDNGLKLLPLLKQGGDAVRRFAAEAELLGVAVSPEAAERLRSLEASTKKLEAAWSGFKNVLIEVGAAIVDAFDISGVVASIGGIREGVLSTLEGVAKGIAMWADMVRLAWDGLLVGVATMVEKLVVMVSAALADQVDKLAGLAQRLSLPFAQNLAGAGDSLRTLGDGVTQAKLAILEAAKARQPFGMTAAVEDFFATLRQGPGVAAAAVDPVAARMAQLAGEIASAENKISADIAMIGRSPIELKIAELKGFGATEQMLARLRELAAEKVDVELGMKLEGEHRDPAAAFTESLDNLQRLWDSGKISAEVYGKAAEAAFAKAEGALKLGGELQPAKAVRSGTQEAAQAVIRHQLSGMAAANTPEERQRAILEAGLKAQERAAAAAEQMVLLHRNNKPIKLEEV